MNPWEILGWIVLAWVGLLSLGLLIIILLAIISGIGDWAAKRKGVRKYGTIDERKII